MTERADAYARRITEAEMVAALRTVRHTPIVAVGRTVGSEAVSGHYETDHEAHARLVMEAVAARRRALRLRRERAR